MHNRNSIVIIRIKASRYTSAPQYEFDLKKLRISFPTLLLAFLFSDDESSVSGVSEPLDTNWKHQKTVERNDGFLGRRTTHSKPYVK